VKMKLISRGPACLMFTLFVAMTGAALAGSPVPLVNQPLVPDAVAPGGAAFVLTLNGSGFVSAREHDQPCAVCDANQQRHGDARCRQHRHERDFGQTNTCGSSLAILASCTITVTFAPNQQGSRAGTLSIRDNAPGSLQTVSLNGTGTVGVQLNPNSLNFGGHKGGAVHSLSTTLTTSSALSIAGITITGADTDEFSETNTCGASVAAGKSCTITVTYRPKEVGGDSAAVSITDNGPGSPQSVTLGGWGCRAPQVACRDLAYEGGDIDARRASIDTGCVVAEITALRFDDRLSRSQRGLASTKFAASSAGDNRAAAISPKSELPSNDGEGE
jgi:Abnormal spindle-like microcephaly-assoc'd, ASPM-SPD-2-Hydin